MDDYDGQIKFGDIGVLKLPDICLTGKEKPRKKSSPRKLVPTGDRTRARSVAGAHNTACPTAVDGHGPSLRGRGEGRGRRHVLSTHLVVI